VLQRKISWPPPPRIDYPIPRLPSAPEELREEVAKERVKRFIIEGGNDYRKMGL
jgi:hypothetical protein